MRTLIKISFVFMLLSLVVGCKNDKSKATKAGDAVDKKAKTTATAKTYNISSGTIHWTGSKPTTDHSGTMNIESGTLTAEGSKIKSGDFVIDIASLKNVDLAGSPGDQADLEGHLKGGDFFDMANFPKASFSITSVADFTSDDANCKITGNLTLKGVSKSITFPALVVAKDGAMEAISDKFTINRIDWGMKYSSGIMGAIGDRVISDDVSLTIEFKAK